MKPQIRYTAPSLRHIMPDCTIQRVEHLKGTDRYFIKGTDQKLTKHQTIPRHLLKEKKGAPGKWEIDYKKLRKRNKDRDRSRRFWDDSWPAPSSYEGCADDL